MLGLASGARIFLLAEPVNMRKSFEGLQALIEQSFEEHPTSGAYFVFLSRSKDKMKVLYWDADGFAIWYKRLEKGSFTFFSGKNPMNRRDFFLLLEGVVPKKINRRYNIV